MSIEELKASITLIAPSATFEDGEWLTIHIPSTEWKPFAEKIRYDATLHFDYLFCVTAVDWKTHFTMVYHLTSTSFRHSIIVKCKLDREKPEIETVCDIWRTAEFHEREAYDLFGVIFLHHPDLRRLLLTDDFEGYPLRKDFEDPINMIKL